MIPRRLCRSYRLLGHRPGWEFGVVEEKNIEKTTKNNKKTYEK